MGFIQNIICIALLLVGIALIWGVMLIPEEQYECFEEIAEDYCEDNGMYFEKVYRYHPSGKVFECKSDERSIKHKLYNFLDDEIEECEDRK